MQFKSGSLRLIFLKIIAQVILGQFTFTTYPLPVVVGALFCIIFLFFVSLHKNDYFSFLAQLLICNHYTFGYEIGGTFNIAATVAIVTHFIYNTKTYFKNTSFNKTSIILIFIFCLIQVLSLINNDSSLQAKISAALVFFNIFFLFYFSSKITLDVESFYKILIILSSFFLFMFLPSLNQRFGYFNSPFVFFPSLDPNTEWELGIPRSAGTFGNFEYYAEYSISMIAICLPGILTGSFNKISKPLQYLAIAVFIVAIISIILSGTRSSILLLPVLVLFTFFLLGKKLRFKTLVFGSTLLIVFFIMNSQFKLIDTSVFEKRSEGVDLKNLKLSSLLSGEDMNRGDIFSYGFKKLSSSHIFYGDGYFTNREEYIKVHFDEIDMGDIPDYHNLYMSSIVIWGYFGAFILSFLFFNAIAKGFLLYFRIRHQDFFLVDLLLGLNLLFLFFMINQFKIQFIRDANYFILYLLLLVIYTSLINLLSKKIIIIPTQS